MTGPAVSGFQDINRLKKTTLSIYAEETRVADKIVLKATIKNVGASLSFFTQLRLVGQNGKSIKPAFYSDNFVNLLPGELKTVKVEIPAELIENNIVRLFVGGFNSTDIEAVVRKIK